MARADGVDDGPGTGTAPPVGKLPTEPVRHTGFWLVMIAYVVATTALAWAIYARFFA